MKLSVFIYTIILWSWTTEVYGQQIVKRAANCPKITTFNGRVKYRRKGQRAVFKCPNKLQLYGPKRANCQPDGTWDVEPPICVDDGCTPLDISNVYKLDMDVQKGVVKFTCTDDYVLIGESMIYCDGKVWSASMPRCAAPHELTECDFEIDLCGWTNEDSDHTDWIRNTGITPTGDTGPKYDHTYMTEKTGYYMYFETSSPTGTDEYAVLKSPSYPPNLSPICFDFWFHIEGPSEPGHVGDLDVYVIDESQFIDDDDVKPVWEISGNQGADWKRGAVHIEQQDESFQIAFMATKRQSYISDIAIDDVRLYNCTDNSTIGVTTPKSSSKVPPTTTSVVTSTSTPVPTTTNAPTTVASETTESPTTTSAPSTQAPTTESPSTPAPTTPVPSTAAPTTPVATTHAPTTKAPTTTTKRTTKAATTTKSTTTTTTTSAPTTTATVRTTTRKPTTPIPPPPPTSTRTTRTTTVSTTLAPTTSTAAPTTSTPSPTTEQPTVPTTQKLHTTAAPTRTTSRPTPRRTTQPTTSTSIPTSTVPVATQTAITRRAQTTRSPTAAMTTNKPSSSSARNPTTAKATKRSNSITNKTPTVGNTTKDNTISVAEGRSKHPDDETLKPLMIGLGVGIVAGVIIIGVVAYVCVRRKRFYTSRYEDELKPITSAGSVHSLNTDHFYKDEEYESESLK